MKVYIETYGCALNIHDSLVMKGLISSKGHEIVDSENEADAIIVNTCAVRLDTERKIEKRLRNLYKSYRDKKIIVAGCLAKARPYLVAKAVPTASLVSPQNIHLITSVLESPDRKVVLDGDKRRDYLPSISNSRTIATIAISEGCLSNCSFCITKLARRKVSSYPIKSIVETVQSLLAKGVKEIRLTAQDTGVYGYDIYGKKALPDLINSILDKVEGDYKIRIGMVSPQHFIDIFDDIIDLYKDPRIYKFFHLPVQSGSDRVLRIMNREYTIDEYIELVNNIKAKIPDAYIATDIIVGHPGESWEDFMATIELVRKLEFNKIHIARYTYRPRTLAGKLPQIPDPEKKRRSTLLSKIAEEIGLKKNARYQGKMVNGVVLDEGFKRNSLIARTDNYTPIVLPSTFEELLGRSVSIKVTGYTFFDLRGIPVV
jgi:threonylcarbamoyladenosine tRNA methylthiotransferase CDKAL1